MKSVFTVLLVFVACLCILNYNNKDATFNFEEYIANLSENLSYMPKPPSLTDFQSYKEFSDKDNGFFTGVFFRWIGSFFEILWDFVLYPFKLIWFFIKTIGLFFKDLIIWG